jgi:hypothetical protein
VLSVTFAFATAHQLQGNALSANLCPRYLVPAMTLRTLGIKGRLTPFKEFKRTECTSGKCQTEMKKITARGLPRK